MSTDESDWEHVRKIMLTRALAGDAAAQNAMGSLTVDDGLRTLEVKLLDDAEEWFKKAAKGGHTPAVDFLETVWPLVKQEYSTKILQRLKRNK